MNIEDKVAKSELELEALRSEYKKLGDKLSRKIKSHDKLLLELNKDNLKDIAWLVKNPEKPGSYEAIKSFIIDFYGSEYNGPFPQGYHHDGDYVPIQKAFDFSLNTYGKDKKEEYRKNCKHFIETFLPHLDPVLDVESRYNDKFPEMKVVPFKFRSESSGLDYLGYDPESGKWYHFTMCYSMVDVKREFKDFDEAFDFAYKLSNK